MKLFIAVSLACLQICSSSYSFLTLGDWGGAAISDDTHNVYNVADQMVKTATAQSIQFIINTGDNFYWCGIQNTSDYQVETDWLLPYADKSLQVPWYSSLGNHEYGYNVSAQIDLANLYDNWILDDRYYTRRIQLDSSNYLTLLVIDTSPCYSEYRSTNQKYWDPCSTTYPTCSLDSTDDDFEGTCYFHENIVAESCDDQYAWLQTALAAVPADDWFIVVGHHPLDEVDVLDFTTLIQDHGFSMYLNGHSHILNQYTIDNAGIYITSGAGSLVDTPDQTHPITAAKVRGEDISVEKRKSLSGNANSKATVGHSYQTVYSNKIAGFTQHVFNSDFTVLTTNFITYAGATVRTITSNKAGTILSSE